MPLPNSNSKSTHSINNVLLILSTAVLFGIATAQHLNNVTWPNSLLSRKSRSACYSIDQHLAYVQDHIFDSAYGINTANKSEPSYFGHNDMTQLYSRAENVFATSLPNNYTTSTTAGTTALRSTPYSSPGCATAATQWRRSGGRSVCLLWRTRAWASIWVGALWCL